VIAKEILKKVRRIELHTRQVVNTLLGGEYHSAFKGQGVEFAEVREYQMGDDVRTIDWNVTARYGRPFVKVFEEERELTVMLMVDASSSGEFGSVEQTKNEIAVELCALLAFSAIKNNDRVGLIVFTDRIERFVPPKKGRKHVLRVVRELLAQFEGFEVERPIVDDAPAGEAAGTAGTVGTVGTAGTVGTVGTAGTGAEKARRPHPVWGAVGSVLSLAAAGWALASLAADGAGLVLRGAIALAGIAAALSIAWAGFRPPAPTKGRGTDIAGALDFLNRVTTRRGIVFLLSDFQATDFEQPLRIARRKHDVVAITLNDPREVNLAGAGLISVEDPETGARLVVDSSDAAFRQAFERKSVSEHEERARLFRMTGVDAVDIWTDTSYVDPLVRFFTARANRL
jgi:uncharacterized protein (DUF58 family)